MIKLDVGKVAKVKGKPCVYITGEKLRNNEDISRFIEDIVSIEFKNIVVDCWKITDNSNLVSAIRDLAEARYSITYITTCDDDIFPLKNQKRVDFILNTVLPDKDSNNINMQSFQLLADNDSLFFKVKNISDVTMICDFLNKSKLLRPEIYLNLTPSVASNIWEVLEILKPHQSFKFNIDFIN